VTIRQVLEDAAAELPDVGRADVGAGVEWSVAGVVFAAATADTAEFRLDHVVARAALGTPDTRSSARGAEWVAFSPRQLDRFASDRADAWFASAYHRASAAPATRRESRRPR
jgi:hypothetical protein